MKITKILSDKPLTDYAPTWDISIGITKWEDSEKIDAIREWLISNEDMIKTTYSPRHDGGTGLGKDSVTSRFGQYNLFDFAAQMPYLNDLLEFLQKSYIEFVTLDSKTVQEDLHIVSWFNVMRNQQEIKEHNHADTNDSYISGNMHLDNYLTNTYYRSPFTAYRIPPVGNYKGGCTFFPSYVPHKTDVFESNNVRVSIGFDLRLPEYVNLSSNSRPFMTKEILQSLTS